MKARFPAAKQFAEKVGKADPSPTKSRFGITNIKELLRRSRSRPFKIASGRVFQQTVKPDDFRVLNGRPEGRPLQRRLNQSFPNAIDVMPIYEIGLALVCIWPHQVARDVRVEIDRVEQLLLLDVFAVGVGDMNRARTDEQRPVPNG